jgi:hypothetical protein
VNGARRSPRQVLSQSLRAVPQNIHSGGPAMDQQPLVSRDTCRAARLHSAIVIGAFAGLP